MKLIGLCGYAGSGKDCAAEALTAIGWQRVAFADAVRDVALAIDPIVDSDDRRLHDIISIGGWAMAKQYREVRRLLQAIGTEAGRKILGANVWVDTAMRNVNGDTVFTDVRFPNEVAAIRERGGVIVRICRPGVGPVNNHPSETAIDDIAPDYAIANDGVVEHLHASLLSIAQHLRESVREAESSTPYAMSDA